MSSRIPIFMIHALNYPSFGDNRLLDTKSGIQPVARNHHKAQLNSSPREDSPFSRNHRPGNRLEQCPFEDRDVVNAALRPDLRLIIVVL